MTPERLATLRMLASHPTAGFLATTDLTREDRDGIDLGGPFVAAYYDAVPPAIAVHPAAIVEREDVIALIDRVEALEAAAARAGRIERDAVRLLRESGAIAGRVDRHDPNPECDPESGYYLRPIYEAELQDAIYGDAMPPWIAEEEGADDADAA